MQRHLLRSARLGTLAAGVLGATLFASADANAQVSGTSARPLPDVLLLVDTSGSMERMVDGTVPAAAACVPGTPTNANRWGLLVQALTGNIEPFYSCFDVPRASGSDFSYRYGINGQMPYDKDYALDYHQPVSGPDAAHACATIPYSLPGATTGSGVGINKYGSGGNAYDFPDTALASIYTTQLSTALGSGNHRKGIATSPIPPADTCTFQQGNDGQLDATKYYARFALMTFDNDTSGLTGADSTLKNIDVAHPFDGTWSFLRDSSNVYYGTSSNDNTLGAQGKPATVPPCLTITPQEVGARNVAAPPWEGRLVNFPSSDATIYEMDTQNNQIQQTLIASRPYGATPIDGMFDDARNYYWNTAGGPKDDVYTCRDRYIVLLTDGAPNLDLRPSCGPASGGSYPTGVCPYPETAGTIANSMRVSTNPIQHVTTYVIGFAVSGSTEGGGTGFPGGLAHNDCKTWFDATSASVTDPPLTKATNMQNLCNSMRDVTHTLIPGTTAEACCKLNDIAIQGGQVGAYFAESQADIVLAFGRILANIIHSASTKTTPVFSPATSFSNGGVASSAQTVASSGEFIASYIPSSQRPWSGEIDRTRFLCDATTQKSLPQAELSTSGDLESENLAAQTAAGNRLFITVVGDNPSSTAIDSQASIRPFANPGSASSTGGDAITNPADGSSTYKGREVAMNGYTSGLHGFVTPSTDWPIALNVTKLTCQRGRAVHAGVGAAAGTDIIPALDDPSVGPIECSDVVWGFLTSDPLPLNLSGTPSTAPAYNFNTRCAGAPTSPDQGTCSISGTGCSTVTNLCPTGEVCVPICSALGAIYHSTPAILPAPQSLLREEGFRSYQQNRNLRTPVLYAATTDGILHAFKALVQAGPSSNFELWSFVPPAVLPTLSSNYPGGNQILLDGAPVVKETVWDRTSGNTSAAKDWHATLVAGLGSFGGYYAVNVTDADCAGATNNCISSSGGYAAPSEGTVSEAATNGDTSDTNAKHGPHFLWQITDVPSAGAAIETGPKHRTTTLGTKPDMIALFGKNTGTPAVGMIDIKDGSGIDHQVGIAILPGGYENPPVAGGSCARKTKPTGTAYNDLAIRTNVRQWATPDCNAAVPGRGVTIVRLDNGEIIKHFGRLSDVPYKVKANTIDTPFDSPMVGTPVVYPDQVGVPIQKVFIGDADGTLWRIDLTSTSPSAWHANLFEDLVAPAGSSAAPSLSQPINVPPVITTDDVGNIVVNVATGDQESIVVSADVNYLYSIREVRDATFLPHAQVAWYKTFTAAERVTGPMVVFDKTLYFASYIPQHPSGTACDALGTAKIWGFDYVVPFDISNAAAGGAYKWCKAADVSATTGLCGGSPIDEEPQGSDIIPGVSLQASQACVVDGTDTYGNTAFSSVTSSSYALTFGVARPNPAGGVPPQADRKSIKRPLPQTQARIDSWSIVVD